MQHKTLTVVLVGLLTLFFAGTAVIAQTDAVAMPDPQTIEVTAVDGLMLVGDYYPAPDLQLPTILLLHELNTDRSNWKESIELLWAGGYNMLAVDLRGHGDTGGAQDWKAAIADVQTWIDWLKEQPEVQTTGISIIGADFGANLALIACENSTDCLTAIALSPVAVGCETRDCSTEAVGVDEAALEYLDQTTLETVTDNARRSPALMLVGHQDETSLLSIQHIGSARADRVEFATIFGDTHGSALLAERTAPRILGWLDGYTPPNLTDEAIEALVAAADPANGETLFTEGIIDAPQEEGKACRRCHFTDSEEKNLGPGLLNIGERAASRVDEQSAAVYLYHAIVAPETYIVEGFSSGQMPPRYDRGFTEAEIADLVAYLLTLKAD